MYVIAKFLPFFLDQLFSKDIWKDVMLCSIGVAIMCCMLDDKINSQEFSTEFKFMTFAKCGHGVHKTFT